ncbi:MAG TPA: GNAT family N-acetyltransferase [Ktedonobacteraceae bacterium]|nr:GNAT family N-acetyltransferase [Ktedonobacteraceae bacterium]
MAVYLQNLSAREPQMRDLEAVTHLVSLSDMAESGVSDCTKEDILAIWNRPDFQLKTDAWVIVTKKEQLVGYAVVWHEQYACIYMKIVVHPDYRRRGIGTLLLRLAEQRARCLVPEARADFRITLSCTVSHANETARQLLEREGYTLARNYWRIVIEVDDDALHARNQSGVIGKIKVALDIDSQRLSDARQLYERDGVYVIRQYAVFEKLLRDGEQQCSAEAINDQLLLV